MISGRLQNFLVAVKRPDTQPVVVEPNHDLALERYIREGRTDGQNIRIGTQLRDAYLALRAGGLARDASGTSLTFSLI
jgi:sigma54-dependent transcription regulator